MEKDAETEDAFEMIKIGLERWRGVRERMKPVIDWDERLRVYLEEIKHQNDAPTTYRNRKSCFTPWVKWLKENGGRPSN